MENSRKDLLLRTITDDYGLLNEYEKQVLIYLFDNRTITRKNALDLLSLQKTKIHEVFSALVTKGLLEKKGQGRSTHYTLIKNEDKV